KDIAERIKRLYKYSAYSSASSKEVKPEIDVKNFVSRQEFDIGLLAENFSLQSNIFRHSLRVSICMITGYLIAQFLPFGHGYWILLTIVTILKPAYSISKKRNAERLTGTIAGAVAGFLLLYYVKNNTILFGFMIFSMIIAYSFLQIQYALSVAGITAYVLLSFHFLHPADFRTLTTDRLIDTAIGSFISFTAALFFLPKWEGEQLKEYIHEMMKANLRYFSTAAQAFYKEPPEVIAHKVARKEAYVALANLSDAFQRLLSEPKKNNKQPQLLHHLVVSNHMLTSHIATLASYGHSLAPRYHSDAFKPVSRSIELQMKRGIAFVQNEGVTEEDTVDKGFMRIRDMIQDLLQIRLKELKEGIVSSNVRKELSGFKTITDQFEMIYTITVDANNTLIKMKENVDQ
ncbi:MAG TPA: FUSC family protein, partial [Agriterribacter sp.]|nr:FUSC family protein [Agriterribacter sp.]